MKIRLSELKKIIRDEVLEEMIGRDPAGVPFGKDKGAISAPDQGPVKKWLSSKLPKSKREAMNIVGDKIKRDELIKATKLEYPQFGPEDLKKALVDIITSLP